MNQMTHRTVRLGPVDVGLRTDQPTVLQYLADFYVITDEPAAAGSWTVGVRLGPARGMPRNPWGVGYLADPDERVLLLRAETPLELAMTARKAVREALIEHCEQRGYVMLHASAFASEEIVVVVVGDKGSGKTTLAVKAALRGGYRLVSNDHLMVYPHRGAEPISRRLAITSLPTPIPVKVGTYLDLEGDLPKPWDDEGLDIEAFRDAPAAERYRQDKRLLYTYRALSQDNPIRVPLGASGSVPRVVVVLAEYAAAGYVGEPPLQVAAPDVALWPHVRSDWVFDPTLNTEHIPRTQRDRDAYLADAEYLLAALIERAEIVAWAHAGDPQPLLNDLGVTS